MRFAIAFFAGTMIVLPACTSKQNCVPSAQSNPNYARPEAWACRPDVDGDACDVDLTAVEVLADGTTRKVPFVKAEDPPVDCFYVYPTVDMTLRTRLHENLADHDGPYRSAAIQAARFGEVCRVYAPLYRQVTIGTYASAPEVRDFCLDAAFADVRDAFDHYLANDNQGRPFVLLSHSQGSHMVSRLIRQRIDNDPALRAKLVVALPIGGHLGTDNGGRTGGSFQNVPVCTTAEEQGCVVGYRSYPENAKTSDRDASLKEGKVSVCVHPGDIAGSGPTRLSRSYFPARNGFFTDLPEGIADQAPYVLYRDFYEARCVIRNDVKAFEIRRASVPGDTRQSPVDLEARMFGGNMGLHIFDFQLALGDLIDLVRVKADAHIRSR